MTVCAVGINSLGWKNIWICHNKISIEDLKECVKNNQFTLNDTISHVLLGTDKVAFKAVFPSWKSSMATPALGVCHTLVYKELMSGRDKLYVVLTNETSSFRIYLHDPTFFLQKSDSYFIPFVLLNNPKGEQYKIVTSQNTRMNRHGMFSCTEDTGYNFNQCVTDSLATKIGCRFLWPAEQTIEKFKVCNTTEKVNTYWNIYNTMYEVTQQELEDLTGCQVPCRYNHYSVVGMPALFEMINVTYITLSFASTDLTEIQEVLLLSST